MSAGGIRRIIPPSSPTCCTAFEHPEKYSEEGLKSAAGRCFRDPRLMRCLALASDPQAFTEQYLDDLAEEYMRVFIAGDSSHAAAPSSAFPQGLR